jgi:hypothetical protein
MMRLMVTSDVPRQAVFALLSVVSASLLGLGLYFLQFDVVQLATNIVVVLPIVPPLLLGVGLASFTGGRIASRLAWSLDLLIAVAIGAALIWQATGFPTASPMSSDGVTIEELLWSILLTTSSVLAVATAPRSMWRLAA